MFKLGHHLDVEFSLASDASVNREDAALIESKGIPRSTDDRDLRKGVRASLDPDSAEVVIAILGFFITAPVLPEERVGTLFAIG